MVDGALGSARKLRTVDEARLREIAEALGAEGDSGASLDTTDHGLGTSRTYFSPGWGKSQTYLFVFDFLY